MIKKLFLASIAKDVSKVPSELDFKGSDLIVDPEGLNEDAWEFSLEPLSIALSDGASESYNSQLWAKVLCSNFVKLNQATISSCVEASINDYIKSHDLSNMSWAQHTSYERGSFATFIGLKSLPNNKNKVEIINIGDSCCFIFKKTVSQKIGFTKKFSTKKRKQERLKRNCFTKKTSLVPLDLFDVPNFKENPTLLSSKKSQNIAVLESCTKEITLTNNNVYYLILSTDAVAEWLISQQKILSHPHVFLDKVLNDDTNVDYKYFYNEILHARKNRLIKIDDSTLMIFKINRL